MKRLGQTARHLVVAALAASVSFSGMLATNEGALAAPFITAPVEHSDSTKTESSTFVEDSGQSAAYRPQSASDTVLPTQPQPVHDEEDELAEAIPARSMYPESINLTWLIRSEDIAVGAALTPRVTQWEYRWLQYDVAGKKWSTISDWAQGNWASWKSTPGVYWLHLEVRDARTRETVGSKTIPFKYSAGTTTITGTYAGWRDGGVLLGLSSNNAHARYAIKIYNYDIKKWVVGFDNQWALWHPSAGRYWTHFEVYTSDGRLADTRTYAFGVELAGYTTPGGYLKVTDHITSLNGQSNTLTPGFNGVKVRIVQQKLGVWYSSKLATMDAATVRAVHTFQRRVGLRQDGIVGQATWQRLNTGLPWTIDGYQAQPVALSATKNERIETMIDYAWHQSGSDYVWGGAGSYRLGFDCSGLVLQSLYAAGLDPQPINVLLHAYPSYRTSQELYRHPQLMHVPTGQRLRGDLVFYVDASGTIYHTGIYIGSDQIIHTDWMGRPARVDTVYQGRLAPTVVRPFP